MRNRREFDRNEDMGGSRWSGASGRGGIRERGAGYDRYPPYEGHREGLPDERTLYGEGGYGGDVRLPGERYRGEGGFVRERGFGHVPGQRWGGGYGGSADERRAEEQRGPHYGKGPKGYKRSDARTREDVCEAIADQGYIDATDVEVSVQDGIVTLRGTVTQRHHKRALEQLVERCRGVDEVNNELRLKRHEVRADGNGNHRNGKGQSS